MLGIPARVSSQLPGVEGLEMDGWTCGCMDAKIHGWMDGWRDGCEWKDEVHG